MLTARSEIEGLIHPEQSRAYSLLYDWWTAEHQDPGISLNAILNFVSQSDDLERLASIEKDQSTWPKSSAERQDVFLRILRHLELKRWPTEKVLEIPGRSVQENQYHYVMYNLFILEFQKYGTDENKIESVHSDRRWWRDQAIASASCQQFAVNLYTNDTFGWTTPPKMQESLEFGPAIGKCTWLPDLPHDRAKSMPHYLWDIDQHRTIYSKDLYGFQPYTCVSHTWGRWRLEHEMATLPDVPWTVPRNSKFKVEDLPMILHRVPCKTRYIWLDLLCIPQDHSELGEKEIARQGDIFRSALHAIVWLNDITGFGALKHILSYMALQFLRFRPDSEEQREQDRMVQRSLDNVVGQRSSFFVNDPYPEPEQIQKNPENLQLNPWFSSLWTLQEVCLRPDMWLCDSNWELLSTDGKSAVPINALVCLLNKFMYPACDIDDPSFQSPPPGFTVDFYDSIENLRFLAFREVLLWYNKTGMEVLLKLSRVNILALGDRRICTDRRAEAIMSALGTTEWFVPGGENDQDLILGKYPAKFIHELQRKIPQEFFGYINREVGGDSAPELSGSLLPFGRGENEFSSTNPFRQAEDVITLPSLSTWTVEPPNGHVRIGRACLISSPFLSRSHHPYERLDTTFLPLRHIWPMEDVPVLGPVNRVKDLHQWVREREYDTYMVATEYRDLNVYFKSDVADISGRYIQVGGIVLKGNDTQNLIKMGFFHSMFRTSIDPVSLQEEEFIFTWKLPVEEEVNWRVL